MNYQIIAGVSASVLSVFPFTSYTWNTIKGKTNPHPHLVEQ